MLSKIWKKIGLIILIIACLWNIIFKLVHIISFDKAMDNVKVYFEQMKKNKNK